MMKLYFFSMLSVVIIGCGPPPIRDDGLGGTSGGGNPVPTTEKVTYSRNPNHAYGLDRENKALSVEQGKEGDFDFQLNSTGGGFSETRVESENSNQIAIPDAFKAFPYDQAQHSTKVTAAAGSGTQLISTTNVDLNAIGTNTETIDKVSVLNFGKLTRSPLFYRVLDNGSPGTDPGNPPVTPGGLTVYLRTTVFNQAVFDIQDITTIQTRSIAYDVFPKDGLLDVYMYSTGLGQEVEPISASLAGTINSPAIAFVKGIKIHWVASSDVPAGSSRIPLQELSMLRKDMFITLGLNNQVVKITKVNGVFEEIEIEPHISVPIKTGDTFFSTDYNGIAFPGRSVAFVMKPDPNGTCTAFQIYAHELAHLPGFGAMRHVKSDINLMHPTCGVNKDQLLSSAEVVEEEKDFEREPNDRQWERMHTK
jgi:hypothetical protein